VAAEGTRARCKLGPREERRIARRRDAERAWICILIVREDEFLDLLLDLVFGRELESVLPDRFQPRSGYSSRVRARHDRVRWIRERFEELRQKREALRAAETLARLEPGGGRRRAVARIRVDMARSLLELGPHLELCRLLVRRIEERYPTQRVRNRKSSRGVMQTCARIAAACERIAALEERLILGNLGLVASVAARYTRHGLSFQDLVQEGCIGLIKAVERFDHRLGCRFATYANWWIRQCITRAISDQSRTIRLPVHISQALGKIQRLRDIYYQKHRREPTVRELSTALHWSDREVADLLNISRQPASLSTPVGEDSESMLRDLLPDEGAVRPDQTLEFKEIQELLFRAVAALNEREKWVITLRFGLGDLPEQTLEQVGRKLGLTRERIRQIEKAALRKLRSAPLLQTELS
jgi:RNA polymerase sigma factor (sigma-70 family)